MEIQSLEDQYKEYWNSETKIKPQGTYLALTFGFLFSIFSYHS